MTIIKYFCLFTILLTLTLFIYPVNAQISVTINQPQGQGVEALGKVGGDRQNLIGNIIKNIITLFYTIGAIGFIVMFLWGAVDWIISGGDKEKVSAARRRITTAIIGVVLLSLTFVIMVVLGQVLGINALQYGTFLIPQISAPPP